MKIYLKDQKRDLKTHLEYLKRVPVMKYEKKNLVEKISIIRLQTNKPLEQINLDFLFNYQIFPVSIMTFETEWATENRKMKVNDTIVQQVCLPSFKYFSAKLIFGVRIKEMIDNPNEKGFSYETLEGHVEKGISTFTLEESDGNLIFKIKTHSKPGNFFSRLFAPVFSLPYQQYCTNKALRNVKVQIARQEN